MKFEIMYTRKTAQGNEYEEHITLDSKMHANEFVEIINNLNGYELIGVNTIFEDKVEDLVESCQPELITIRNNDYRGCKPVDRVTFDKFYRGTDVLRTDVREWKMEDGTLSMWL